MIVLCPHKLGSSYLTRIKQAMEKEANNEKGKKKRKVLWWLVFLCSLMGFTYQSYEFLSEYLSYPITVSTFIETGKPIKFPSVTVCGYNKYTKKGFSSSPYCEQFPRPKICPKKQNFPGTRRQQKMYKSVQVTMGFIAVPPPRAIRFCKKKKSTVEVNDPSSIYPEIVVDKDNELLITTKFGSSSSVDDNPKASLSSKRTNPLSNSDANGRFDDMQKVNESVYFDEKIDISDTPDRNFSEYLSKLNASIDLNDELDVYDTLPRYAGGMKDTNDSVNHRNSSYNIDPLNSGITESNYSLSFASNPRSEIDSKKENHRLHKTLPHLQIKVPHYAYDIRQEPQKKQNFTEENIRLQNPLSTLLINPNRTYGQRRDENSTNDSSPRRKKVPVGYGFREKTRGYKEDKVSRETKYQRILREIEATTTVDERMSMGHSFSSIFKRCLFMGETCDSRNFTETYNYMFGNCWTFDPKNKQGQTTTTQSFGPQFGLQMDLYLDPATSFDSIDMLRGFKVLVHAGNKFPFPQDQGIDIDLNRQTSIAISENYRKWLPKPFYSRCENKDPSQYFTNASKNYGYSTSLCNKDCLQELVFKKCGCIDLELYFFESKYSSPVCNVNNQTQICCLEELFDSMSDGIDCGCTIPCEQTEYRTIVSQLRWTAFSNDYILGMMQMGRQSSIDRVYESNMARVRIFFESIDAHYHILNPKYQVVDVFSNLGGQIGLWLGISLVALYEAGEQMALTCFQKIKNFLGKHHESEIQQPKDQFQECDSVVTRF